MRVTILRAAQRDLDNGWFFYEKQEIGLGDYFLNSLIADIRSLKVVNSHQYFHGYHRRVATKFPFSILYKIEDDQIRVHAVFDNRRDPQLISERLN